jgi:hypothetical protein
MGARNRHSDKEKFCSNLNRPESCEMSERLLETLRKSGDFQSEYALDAAATLQIRPVIVGNSIRLASGVELGDALG